MTGHMVFRGLALTLTAQPPRKTRRKGNEEEEEKDGPLIGGKIGRNYPKEPGVSSSPSFLPPLGSLLPPAGHSPGGWWMFPEEPIAPDPPGLHQRVFSPLPSPAAVTACTPTSAHHTWLQTSVCLSFGSSLFVYFF